MYIQIHYIIITMHMIRRKLPVLGKRLCSNLKIRSDSEASYRNMEEYMMRMMPKFVGGCGIVGGGYGMYTGYCENRHRSYSECSALTTAYFFMGAVFGAWGGIVSWFISPVLVPALCIGAPVAGGAVMVKYFDKNANMTPDTKKEDIYTIWKDK